MKFDYNGLVLSKSAYSVKHDDTRDDADKIDDLVTDYNNLVRVYNALHRAVMSNVTN